MDFSNIYLKPDEKRSLFLFHFKKKRLKEKIKCFRALYEEYGFIKQNYTKELDAFMHPIPDGTYSISDRYERYKVYRKERRIESLPNWIAITFSLFSLIVSVVTLLWQLGYIQP